MKISNIKYALGENKISLSDRYSNIDRLTDKTGIPFVFETKGNSLDLAIKASENVLEHYDKSKIDLVILVTQSPVDYLPANSITLAAKLGLSKKVFTFDFNQGCSGFVQSFLVIEKLLERYNNALLVTTDCYRQKLDFEDRSTNAVFSDGSCAMIINRSQKGSIIYDDTITDGSFRKFLFQSAGEENNGKLHMSGGEIWLFTRKVVVPQIQKAIKYCENNNIKIGGIYMHQASKVVVEGIKKTLGDYKSIVFENYMNHANTVSSTIPILIHDNPIENINGAAIFAGFGVGLTSTVLIYN
jgi:3-oxoacyl-[acyl-carrier-protein] synthase-3